MTCVIKKQTLQTTEKKNYMEIAPLFKLMRFFMDIQDQDNGIRCIEGVQYSTDSDHDGIMSVFSELLCLP